MNHCPYPKGSSWRRWDLQTQTILDDGYIPLADYHQELQAVDPIAWQQYAASVGGELVPNLACVGVFLTDQKGQFEGRGPLWVKYGTHHSNFKGFIRPGNPVPSNSVALQCYRQAVEYTDPKKETWWISGKPRTYLVQAASLPTVENPEYPKVVVMLFPSSYRRNA